MMWSIALILFGAFACGGSENEFYFDQPEPSEDEDREDAYHLVVDLQDGFSADTVQVELDGELIWEDMEVTTALLTGLAASIETSVSNQAVTLTVRIPTQNAVSEIELDLETELYIGVSVVNGEVRFYVSDSPFGYG